MVKVGQRVRIDVTGRRLRCDSDGNGLTGTVKECPDDNPMRLQGMTVFVWWDEPQHIGGGRFWQGSVYAPHELTPTTAD